MVRTKRARARAKRRLVTPAPIAVVGALVIALIVGGVWFALRPQSPDEEATFESRLGEITSNDTDGPASQDLPPDLEAAQTAEEALEEYAAAVAADPRDHTALSQLAATEQILGKASDAITHLEAAIAVEPTAEYYRALAPIYASVGRWTECIDAWTAYLDLADPDPVVEGEVHAAMASAYEGMHEYDKAKAELKKALSLDPNNAQYKTRLADYAN